LFQAAFCLLSLRDACFYSFYLKLS
jgi:hypothetical protein